MRLLVATLCLAFAASAGTALAQHPGKRGGEGAKGPGQFTPSDDRRRDSARDSARGDHARPDRGRSERMRPEERDRLRRDIEDANRGMERRR